MYMDKNRRSGLFVCVAVFLTIAILCMAACGGTTSSTDNNKPGSTQDENKPGDDQDAQDQETVTVTVDYNYEGAQATTLTVKAGDVAEEPAAPERAHHAFTGWFSDAECTSAFDFEEALYENAVIYAGWNRTEAVVTLNGNYDGAQPTEAVIALGEAFAQPSSPVRDGFMFKGWYRDAEGTEVYDFNEAVEEDLTLYAAWEEETGDTLHLTYMWNYEGAPDGGVANVASVKKNGKDTGFKAVREGYTLAGWYTDPECTQAYDFSKRVTKNATLYARWLYNYLFEAEYVDLTGLNGSGYSGGYGGTGLIEKDSLNLGASNDFYVTNMYMPNLTLTFVIQSDKAVDDAVLKLRLGAEFFSMTLTDEMYLVEVNGEKISYKDIELLNVPSYESGQKLPFKDFTLQSKVALKEGENIITLKVNNDIKMNDSGTLYATAPMVDCIYVSTDAVLSWTPKEDNLNGRR
ncbi:MAG: InlB B-repeat-containing protein [Lachnospiraceae bacterium]|nr:InlB B-repeat-containing protein [Lachnospiraceae bacterium]